MWNSCAMYFMNNLLKINFNGKLRTEISSAVLCSQWVTCLHKSTQQDLAPWAAQLATSPWEQGSDGLPGLLPAGVRAGGWQGAAFPQSAQLWAGFCFGELQMQWACSGIKRRQWPSGSARMLLSPLHRSQEVIQFLGSSRMLSPMAGKPLTLPVSAFALLDGSIFPYCIQERITSWEPQLNQHQAFQVSPPILVPTPGATGSRYLAGSMRPTGLFECIFWLTKNSSPSVCIS